MPRGNLVESRLVHKHVLLVFGVLVIVTIMLQILFLLFLLLHWLPIGPFTEFTGSLSSPGLFFFVKANVIRFVVDDDAPLLAVRANHSRWCVIQISVCGLFFVIAFVLLILITCFDFIKLLLRNRCSPLFLFFLLTAPSSKIRDL